ncbi:recombinase family protein [Vagococcus sp. BWB3-3]|uniref:Recombinase family protein n=1 Tax=Vagococcus allomyrinae TaxID=2794353 RepID=A0A940P706_9ENTE|nr:recombinase family protein [Vagococcus allomyrinae]MBP1042814.1 recombinase family protein [Vagococcus allomyrinae]
MAIYGYVRKGFPNNETEQLTSVMTYSCDELFFESSSLLEATELAELISRLKEHDSVVVASLKVFGMNLQHLRPILTQFQQLKVRLVSIIDHVDTEIDTFFYPLFDVFSEVDFDCKSERIKQQIVHAREIGKNVGRPTLDDPTIEQIYSLYHEYKWSMRRIATECNVSLGSVFKYTQEKQAKVVS